MPAGAVVHWRHWNEAEWRRLELAASGPKPVDVSLRVAFGDSSVFEGLVPAFW